MADLEAELELASAAAAVAAVTKALQEYRLSKAVFDELWSQAIRLLDCASLRTSAVPLGVRQAAVALAHELQAANTALKSRLLAAGDRPYGEALLSTAQGLQSLARALTTLFKMVPHGDSDLAFRILAAGVVVVDGGSLAHHLWSRTAADENAHIEGLTLVAQLLDDMSTLDEGHKCSLAVLRAGIFRPEAILTCLRRLLPGQDPPGKRTEKRSGVLPLSVILHPGTCFAAERAAIERDAQLQACIVASLEASIRRCVGLSRERSLGKDAYLDACAAVILHGAKELLAQMRERVISDPTGFMRLLVACFDIILERPLPEVDVAGVQLKALCSWGFVVANAYFDGSSDWSPMVGGQLPPVADSLGCICRAAAAAAIMLQEPSAGEDTLAEAFRGLCLMMNAVPVLYLYPGVDHAAVLEASSDAALRALFLESATALESITRVAALLPARQQLGYLTNGRLIGSYRAAEVFVMKCVAWCWPMERPQPNVMLRAAMIAAAGVVESLVKLALITAGVSAGTPQSVAPGLLKLQLEILDRLAYVCLYMIGKMAPGLFAAEGAMDAGTLRLWQGVALAVSSTVAALGGSERRELFDDSAFMALPLMLLHWPGICGLMTAVPEGRSAVYLAVICITTARSGLAEGELRSLVDKKVRKDILAGCSHDDSSAAALILAQLGALTQLASWGEQLCREPLPDVSALLSHVHPVCLSGYLAEVATRSALLLTLQECLAVLRLVRELVERAVDSSGVAEVQAAHGIIETGPVDISSAAYWRRLRTEVTEPLAAALEARAAAARDPAQLAVDVAEALATRTCAFVGCTTVVGASEAAAPRGKRCSGCRLVRYCGAACQTADWPAHKAACRELRQRSAGGS